MFDIGWGELVVIGVVALIAIGPKELPAVLRATGQWMGKIRRMANEFQDQFKEAMREAELDDLKKKVDDMTNTAGDFTNFDPLGSVRKDIESAVGDAPSFDSKMSDSKPPEPAAEPSATEPSSTEAPPVAQLAPEPASQPASEPAPQEVRKAGEGA
jgi:sec-independent protein translocase protein TatB